MSSRSPRLRRLLLTSLAIVAACTALWLWLARPLASPEVAKITLRDGAPATLAKPARDPQAYVIILMPHDVRLGKTELLALARHNQTRLIQVELDDVRDCKLAQERLQAAMDALGAKPTLIAGVEVGGELAYRWLAAQDRDDARALAVGMNVGHTLCDDPLPEAAEHGAFSVRWNDNPGDTTARFVRGMPNAEITISEYTTSTPQMLMQGIHAILAGKAMQVPVVEVRNAQPEQSDTVTIFYSGDGGWRDLDRAIAMEMTQQGYPVAGVDVLRYFWQHKSPDTIAADLSHLMQKYREKWGAKRFVLAGYSFGADIIPAMYNRLPKEDRDQISALLLLALARSGSFEIEVSGWLGQTGDEAETGPELIKIPGKKIFCVYGSEEVDESGCTLTNSPGEKLQLQGGHHFDGDYPTLALRLMRAIDARNSLAVPPTP